MKNQQFKDYFSLSLGELLTLCGNQDTKIWGLLMRGTECSFGTESEENKLIFSLDSIMAEVTQKDRLKGWPPELLYIFFWIEDENQQLFMNYFIISKNEVDKITAPFGVSLTETIALN